MSISGKPVPSVNEAVNLNLTTNYKII